MKGQFPITGTFIDEITYDIPASNWSDEQWAKDLDYMKEVGMDTVIFIRGGYKDKLIYPSSHFQNIYKDDMLGFILDKAAERDMKVIIGLYTTDLDWQNGNAAVEISKNRIFLKEVVERYGSSPAFTGWYIPHEVEVDRLNITEIMRGLSQLCKDITPDKSVMISPFFKTVETDVCNPMSPEQVYEEWDSIFSRCAENIDICAFQDGTAPAFMLDKYLEKIKLLCDKYNMRHWSNVELFERDPRCMYFPIPFELLRAKLEKSAPYVEKSISFEFSHFLSPQSIYPSARNLNCLYKSYYGKQEKRQTEIV